MRLSWSSLLGNFSPRSGLLIDNYELSVLFQWKDICIPNSNVVFSSSHALRGMWYMWSFRPNFRLSGGRQKTNNEIIVNDKNSLWKWKHQQTIGNTYTTLHYNGWFDALSCYYVWYASRKGAWTRRPLMQYYYYILLISTECCFWFHSIQTLMKIWSQINSASHLDLQVWLTWYTMDIFGCLW